MRRNEPAAHTCVAPNCTTELPHRLLMCPRHWRMVPGPLQSKLYRAYRKADASGRAILTQDYVDAVAECVAAVERHTRVHP